MGHGKVAGAAMLLALWSTGCDAGPGQATTAASSPQRKLGQAESAPVEIPLWPQGLAIAQPEATGHEIAQVGKMFENVTRPTLTLFRAKGRNTGVALMVYPGGGYKKLAMDLEGTEICDWATAKGISCAVLKYRVPQTWWHDDCGCQRPPSPFLPLQDAQRAMGLLRQRAASLGVDPHKIGVVGFSAGGHLVTAIANATGRSYPALDAADTLSARPDFAMPIYPGHLWSGDDKGRPGDDLSLYPFDPVRSDGPPTFIVQAEDDPVDDVRHSIAYFLALRAKKVPAELHIYAHGGHAFGVRPTAQPITRWPALAETWLHTIGML